MLKRRATLLRFLRILEACWQAGVLGVLGKLLTDQSDLHKVIYGTPGTIFSNVLNFAVYTTNNGSCMPSLRLQRLNTPLLLYNDHVTRLSII